MRGVGTVLPAGYLYVVVQRREVVRGRIIGERHGAHNVVFIGGVIIIAHVEVEAAAMHIEAERQPVAGP